MKDNAIHAKARKRIQVTSQLVQGFIEWTYLCDLLSTTYLHDKLPRPCSWAAGAGSAFPFLPPPSNLTSPVHLLLHPILTLALC